MITEVNRARRRVVGSISRVLRAERAAAAEKVWAEIEDGKRYTGTVKSLTSYGAFVDIGGVDGMVHISELSWSRIKHPSEVVKVGDTVDVYVISAEMCIRDSLRDMWGQLGLLGQDGGIYIAHLPARLTQQGHYVVQQY